MRMLSAEANLSHKKERTKGIGGLLEIVGLQSTSTESKKFGMFSLPMCRMRSTAVYHWTKI